MLRYSIHFSYGCHLTNREVFICLMTTKATGEKKHKYSKCKKHTSRKDGLLRGD